MSTFKVTVTKEDIDKANKALTDEHADPADMYYRSRSCPIAQALKRETGEPFVVAVERAYPQSLTSTMPELKLPERAQRFIAAYDGRQIARFNIPVLGRLLRAWTTRPFTFVAETK